MKKKEIETENKMKTNILYRSNELIGRYAIVLYFTFVCFIAFFNFSWNFCTNSHFLFNWISRFCGMSLVLFAVGWLDASHCVALQNKIWIVQQNGKVEMISYSKCTERLICTIRAKVSFNRLIALENDGKNNDLNWIIEINLK